jgi:hypothetical protein
MTTVGKGFYCPASVGSFTSYFSVSFPDDGTLKHRHGFVKNLGYNFQYLEFLNHLLTEKQLHSTVTALTQKTFVVVGMGIVEALLWYTIRKNKLQVLEDWEVVHELSASEFTEGDRKRRAKILIEEHQPKPKESAMTLDVMRKKVEGKKLLGVDTQVYRDLNHLRGLRNRVHIHVMQGDKDTDWFKFNDSDVQLMKKALLSILQSPLFAASHDSQKYFAFLKPKDA